MNSLKEAAPDIPNPVQQLQMNNEVVTFHARCHCGNARNAYSLSFTGSTFSLKSSLCHCVDCRRVTGSLIGTWAVIPMAAPDTSRLKSYASSAEIQRYFCRTCGASIYNIGATEWDLATGLIEDLDHSLLDRVQLYSLSSKDGGASIWLPDKLYDRPLIRLSSGRYSHEVSDATLATVADYPHSTDSSFMHGSCHCGAIQFYLERPKPDAQDTKHVGMCYELIEVVNGHPFLDFIATY